MQLNLMDYSNPIQKRFKELYSMLSRVNIEMISSQQMITTASKFSEQKGQCNAIADRIDSVFSNSYYPLSPESTFTSE